jgi:hypothetical protein
MPNDVLGFSALARAYLTELRERGSEIIPSKRSVNVLEGLLIEYVFSDPANGVAVVAVDCDFICGFTIVGGFGLLSSFDTDFGRIAYGHGTYVHPSNRGQHLSDRMRDLARTELRARGFDTIIGGVHLANQVGAASLKNSPFTWYQLVGYERLTKPDQA